VVLEEEANPHPTWLFGGDIFDNGSDGLLINRMAGGSKVEYPILNNLLLIWGEKHLLQMGFVSGMYNALEVFVESVVGQF
jgi:hypothetical protein